MQRDIAAGREPELDAIAGAVLRAAARHQDVLRVERVRGDDPGAAGVIERARRVGLVCLMAVLTINIYTGARLAAVWVGSKTQKSGQPDVGTLVVVAVTLGVLCSRSCARSRTSSRACTRRRPARGRAPARTVAAQHARRAAAPRGRDADAVAVRPGAGDLGRARRGSRSRGGSSSWRARRSECARWMQNRGPTMSAEGKNFEAIVKAKADHNARCPFPPHTVRMNPFEIERMKWEEGDVIAGLVLEGDPKVGTGAFRLICDGMEPPGARDRGDRRDRGAGRRAVPGPHRPGPAPASRATTSS